MRSNVCSANKAAAAAGDSHDIDGDHDDYDDDAKIKMSNNPPHNVNGDVESTVRTDGSHKKVKWGQMIDFVTNMTISTLNWIICGKETKSPIARTATRISFRSSGVCGSCVVCLTICTGSRTSKLNRGVKCWHNLSSILLILLWCHMFLLASCHWSRCLPIREFSGNCWPINQINHPPPPPHPRLIAQNHKIWTLRCDEVGTSTHSQPMNNKDTNTCLSLAGEAVKVVLKCWSSALIEYDKNGCITVLWRTVLVCVKYGAGRSILGCLPACPGQPAGLASGRP